MSSSRPEQQSEYDSFVMVGEQRLVMLSSLRLDPKNPRLPKSLQDQNQEDLAVHLELGFDAFTVAQSIAGYGYFSSEPLIVIPGDEHDTWTVVEGNRRLTALIGLTNAGIRNQFASSERWEELVAQSEVTEASKIPVVVAKSRESVTPIVGFRHISGILQWRPFAQATYISALIDSGKSYTEVAKLIGIDKKRVSDLYRDQAIVAQAETLGLHTSNMEKEFSIVTVAMSSTKLREHIGAPLGSRLTPGDDPIPAGKVDELGELVGWIFGDGEHEPVITDSRQISMLGNVVASPVGLQSLRDGDTLDQAKQRVSDTGMAPRVRLINRLTAAKNALLAAVDDLADHADDPEVGKLIEEVEDALGALRSTV